MRSGSRMNVSLPVPGDSLLLRTQRAGDYQVPALYSAETSGATIQDRLYFVPLAVGVGALTLDRIGLEVVAIGTGTVRLGVYSDNAGLPNALLLDAGAFINGATAAYQEAIVSLALTASRYYWLATVSQGGTTTVRTRTTTPMVPQTTTSSVSASAFEHTGVVAGALPATAVPGSTGGRAPKVLTRFA